MISHISLGVRDLARSTSFYDEVMAPLGYERARATKDGEAAYGPAGSAVFWIYETPGDGLLGSPGTHIAFQARNREALHSAAEAARSGGCSFTRDPGPHPDIGPNYYGAVLLDPDGHKIELVIE